MGQEDQALKRYMEEARSRTTLVGPTTHTTLVAIDLLQFWASCYLLASLSVGL